MRVVPLPVHLLITHGWNVLEITVRPRQKGRLNDATEVCTRTKLCYNHVKDHSAHRMGCCNNVRTHSDPPNGRLISKTTLADPLNGHQISKTTLTDPLIGRLILKTTLADPPNGRLSSKTTLADPLNGRFTFSRARNDCEHLFVDTETNIDTIEQHAIDLLRIVLIRRAGIFGQHSHQLVQSLGI